MRTRILFLGLLLLLPWLASCKKNEGPSDGRPLLILLRSDIRTFDPQIPFDDSTYVFGNIFEPLVEFDSLFRLSPGLAKRWTNPDDKTWRFYLEKDAHFSDGTPLRASDVKFSIERLKSLADSELRGFVEHISSINIVDDHTIDIKTDTPVSILNNLVFIPIMSEKHVRMVGDKISETPLGTGPYKLVRWEKKKKIVLTRNEHHKLPPQVRDVEFIISVDPQKVLDDILRLKPDLSLSIPFRRIEEFQKRKTPDLSIISANGIVVQYLIFNMSQSAPDFQGKNPLRDLRLRKALAHATDKDEIIKMIWQGYARPATQLVAPEIFGYDTSITPPEYNPEKAKALIAEGGYSDLEIPLYTQEGGTYRFENMLIQQWQKAGIKAILKPVKEDLWLQTLESGKFAIAELGYICTSGDASEFLTFALHTRDEKKYGYGKGNYAYYSNAEVDRIGEENLRILDPRERLEMLKKSMKIVTEELPYLPLVISHDVYIVSDRIDWAPPVSGEIRVKNISFKSN